MAIDPTTTEEVLYRAYRARLEMEEISDRISEALQQFFAHVVSLPVEQVMEAVDVEAVRREYTRLATYEQPPETDYSALAFDDDYDPRTDLDAWKQAKRARLERG